MIDVVVPSVSGREDSLARAIESYQRHTHPDCLNIIVIRDEPTVGLAWNKGIEASTAPYIHLSCDDLEVTSSTWAGACVEVMDQGKLPCPVVSRPDGSLESCGGDMNVTACLISTVQPNGTEVDFSVVPFGSREQVEAIGMTEGHYLSDTYFSHKGRQLGYSTVIVSDYALTHHHSNVKRRPVTQEDHRLYHEALNA